MAKKKGRVAWYRRWWAIVLFVIVGIYIFSLIIGNEIKNSDSKNIDYVTNKSYCGNNICENDESYSSCPQDCKIAEIQRIAEEYHRTHTYTLNDFFVCSDMAIDVWNLIKTQGINAQICAGNVEEDIHYTKINGTLNDDMGYFNKMNHVWVEAELEPFKYVAVETTGGFLVWGENKSGGQGIENNLYYSYPCFSSPKQFKSFSDARTNLIKICSEAINMENYWNNNYVGRILTPDAYEYKGGMNQKEQDCLSVVNEMKGLLN